MKIEMGYFNEFYSLKQADYAYYEWWTDSVAQTVKVMEKLVFPLFLPLKPRYIILNLCRFFPKILKTPQSIEVHVCQNSRS